MFDDDERDYTEGDEGGGISEYIDAGDYEEDPYSVSAAIGDEEDYQRYAPKFEEKATMKDFERTGITSITGSMGTSIDARTAEGKRLNPMQQLINRISKTSDETFAKKLSKITEEINEPLSQEIIQILPKIEKLKYKNPNAFLLGYMSLINGRLDAEHAQNIFKKHGEHLNVSHPDIVRYGLYLQSLFLA